jgi:NAD(P)-dependent dehydrogenase (short-subunit alcohol dehydrogenase family)
MRTWFITGAARGVGASLAERALAKGDAVVVATMRDPAQVRMALGNHERLLIVPLDLSHEPYARAAVTTTLRHFGRIDALVNDSGYDLLGAIEEASAEEIERVFRCNVFGLLNVTRAVMPQLRKQRSGHIVNIASAGNYGAGAGWGIYCAIKSAVEAISHALSLEGEPLGIRTTVVESGGVRTDSRGSRPLVSTVQRIHDYRVTVGQTRAFAAGAAPQQPSGPGALADAILSLVDAAEPPRRLRVGSGVFRAVEEPKPEPKRQAAPPTPEQWQSLVLPIDAVS